MGEWGFLSGPFDQLQAHSPMLGRFWLFLMLVFRILILGIVASDLFEDEQEEFSCNTLQPGCKQACYDTAFPISLYRFWVFHIVIISTPALVFLLYVLHHHNKKTSSSRLSQMSIQEYRQERHMRRLYIVNVAFRLVAEAGVLVGQWWLYGFSLPSQFPCSRFPCPYTVDCFTSRPAEKTVFICFYFGVGVVSAVSSFIELCHVSVKWLCQEEKPPPSERSCVCQNLHNSKQEEAERQEKPSGRSMSESAPSSFKMKGGSLRNGPSRKVSGFGRKSSKYQTSKTLMV
ncbi:gap junction delta-3 protein-like [Polymixia lowei]